MPHQTSKTDQTRDTERTRGERMNRQGETQVELDGKKCTITCMDTKDNKVKKKITPLLVITKIVEPYVLRYESLYPAIRCYTGTQYDMYKLILSQWHTIHHPNNYSQIQNEFIPLLPWPPMLQKFHGLS